MATIFIEGFDKYGPLTNNSPSPTPADLMVQGEWNNYADAPAVHVVPGLSVTGFALALGGASWVSKTLPTSYARILGGVRFEVAAGGGWSPIIEFDDVGSAQCSIRINTDGTISLRNGNAHSSSQIAVSAASISVESTHYLEWDISFGAAAAYEIWLDGVSVLSGIGNTKTTANSTANAIVIGNPSGFPISDTILDDLYIFDASGIQNNAVLNNNPRIETRYPNSDSQTQWTNVATLIGSAYSETSDTYNSPAGNTLFLRQFTPIVDMTLHSVSIIPESTSLTAKFKAVAYTDSASTPNTLLSDGVEVIGCASGVSLTGNLSASQALTAGTPYWIGYITDSGINLRQRDNTSTTGQKAANTYGSGAPGTAPAMTINQPSWVIWGNCTGATTNWEAVDQDPAAGDISSIKSSTVSDEDLYGFPALSTTCNVFTVAVKVNAKRSDTGSRTMDIRLKSGATDSAGSASGFTPANTYGFLATYFDLNPDGDVTWSDTTANAATAGPKIAS